MRIDDVKFLVCPQCRSSLSYGGSDSSNSNDDGTTPTEQGVEQGVLLCTGCASEWSITDGLARLYREDQVRGTDRLMRVIYNGLPWLHDPAVRYLLPVLQLGGSERALREGYAQQLALEALTPPPDGRPVRILEVGIGAGANLAVIDRYLPPHLEVEIWGPDLSTGMLRVCRRQVRRQHRYNVRLLVADAHALPFADHCFDRVFHIGGIGGFRDPAQALAEMARVAVPGTPIVVVDEQLAPEQRHHMYHRAAFRAITFYDPAPHCPRESLPAGATDVVVAQLSRFYYCLRFTMPERRSETASHRL